MLPTLLGLPNGGELPAAPGGLITLTLTVSCRAPTASGRGARGAGRDARARLVDHGLQRAALRRAAQRVQRRGLRLQAAQAAQSGPEARRAARRARDAVQQRHLRARVPAPRPQRLLRHH